MCFSFTTRLQVSVGSPDYSDSERLGIEQVFSHPNFIYPSRNYDVAVIKLKTPLNFTNTIGAVTLPKSGEQFLGNSDSVVSGFGGFVSCGIQDNLKIASFSSVDYSFCSAVNGYVDVVNATTTCGKLSGCIVRLSLSFE